jgi:hypothetical protein
MLTLQPQNLTDEELLRYATLHVHDNEGLPHEWQRELVQRFTVLLDTLDKILTHK